LRKNSDGDARGAIAMILGAIRTAKHDFVTDPDIDIRSSTEMEWAMSARFQADKDIIVLPNMRVMPMDPSAPSRGIGAKAGFDLTFPMSRSKGVTSRVPEAPKISGPARYQTVRQALESSPMHFARIMTSVGSRDGREIVLEIERLREENLIERNADGEYVLKVG
jgi:2,5-furandicarboxylate decarboxylase 1